jgi:hypothetical protein
LVLLEEHEPKLHDILDGVGMARTERSLTNGEGLSQERPGVREAALSPTNHRRTFGNHHRHIIVGPEYLARTRQRFFE